jgi:hypothetical protein
MIDTAETTLCWNTRQQTAEFLLSLQQLMRPPIPAIKREQVKRKEARRAAMEHEIVESRFAPAVDSNDLAINDGVAGEMFCNCFANSANDPNELPFRDTSWGRRSITARARKPSYLSSKIQLGSSNGKARVRSGIGWSGMCSE